jgi:tetratricopeptide (TPR) repeat protein
MSTAMKSLVGAALLSLISLATGGAASAQVAAPTTPGTDFGSKKSNKRASEAAQAIRDGKSAEGLRLAEKAIKSDSKNPWAYYNKADALSRMNRVDEAVATFREAERRFSPADMYGKSIAIYGRANVLDQAGRCEEARKAFGEYAAFIRTDDSKSADMAERFADACVARPASATRQTSASVVRTP